MGVGGSWLGVSKGWQRGEPRDHTPVEHERLVVARLAVETKVHVVRVRRAPGGLVCRAATAVDVALLREYKNE